MKKKTPLHPRLYVSEELIGSSKKILKYLSNDFIGSKRVLKEKFFDINDDSIHCKNKIEYEKLNKFIKIQKIVLNKHKKSRNYDAEKVVSSSIMLMQDFKKKFDIWFLDNKN
ncbi:MAG: hypothetical protein CMG50_00950 [Candidatus Marinimicrobia bacterium]|nr:hypothetical protein [Candidatus Neomarinimicrobiota bacterium]